MKKSSKPSSPRPAALTHSEPSEQPTKALVVVAPGTLSEDAQIGQQLTDQYRRAVSGMREVLLFGAMLMQVEAKLVHAGPVSGGRGNQGGIRDWLRENAPEISRSTALRFLGITKAVAVEYETIVGSQVAGRYDMPTLALADPVTLPEKARLKQGELFDYVAGTSQRSWLDQFKGDPYAANGGKRTRPNGTNRRTRDMKEFDDNLELAQDWYRTVFTAFVFAYKTPAATWMHGDDVSLANLADVLKRMVKEVEEVCHARHIVPSKIANWFVEEKK